MQAANDSLAGRIDIAPVRGVGIAHTLVGQEVSKRQVEGMRGGGGGVGRGGKARGRV